MVWVLHDGFKTEKQAAKAGSDIVKLGFAKGVKVVKAKNKGKLFLLYILPIKAREGM